MGSCVLPLVPHGRGDRRHAAQHAGLLTGVLYRHSHGRQGSHSTCRAWHGSRAQHDHSIEYANATGGSSRETQGGARDETQGTNIYKMHACAQATHNSSRTAAATVATPDDITATRPMSETRGRPGHETTCRHRERAVTVQSILVPWHSSRQEQQQRRPQQLQRQPPQRRLRGCGDSHRRSS